MLSYGQSVQFKKERTNCWNKYSFGQAKNKVAYYKFKIRSIKYLERKRLRDDRQTIGTHSLRHEKLEVYFRTCILYSNYAVKN